jgi:hypothetical protein
MQKLVKAKKFKI